MSDTISRLGFRPSRADPDLWIKKSESGYDFIATHVDDLIVVSKNPQEYIANIEQEYALRNIESDPSYSLGTSLKRIEDGRLLMNTETYIKESVRKYEAKYKPERQKPTADGTDNYTIAKSDTPMDPKAHPELDDSPFLNIEKHKEFQHVIGLGQWMILTGRIDIAYSVSSLARFASAPRQGHLEMARRILGYLKKHPKKGILMDPRSPIFNKLDSTKYEEFTHQYRHFKEEMDPYFPEPTIKELEITIFCDSDHAHDLVTGRSITGILAFVGSTPVYWKSKKQTSVHTSTFGAEFTALKDATEVAITLRYHLRSMGILVSIPSRIYCDNMSVCINASNPASSLNKKAVALAYHFVRQNQSGNVIQIHHIRSEDNYADILTKPLPPKQFHDLLYEFMTTGTIPTLPEST